MNLQAESLDCIDTAISWETSQPHMSYGDRSTITPCRRYTRVRSFHDGREAVACEAEMLPSGKGNMFNVDDVRRVFAHPDVVDVLKRAPVSFADPRANGVLRLTVGARRVDVVGGSRSGEAVPPGLAAALELLRAIDVAYENNDPRCKALAAQR